MSPDGWEYNEIRVFRLSLQSCLTVQPCPQDSLGKNTEVSCHALLQRISWDWTHVFSVCYIGKWVLYH